MVYTKLCVHSKSLTLTTQIPSLIFSTFQFVIFLSAFISSTLNNVWLSPRGDSQDTSAIILPLNCFQPFFLRCAVSYDPIFGALNESLMRALPATEREREGQVCKQARSVIGPTISNRCRQRRGQARNVPYQRIYRSESINLMILYGSIDSNQC